MNSVVQLGPGVCKKSVTAQFPTCQGSFYQVMGKSLSETQVISHFYDGNTS